MDRVSDADSQMNRVSDDDSQMSRVSDDDSQMSRVSDDDSQMGRLMAGDTQMGRLMAGDFQRSRLWRVGPRLYTHYGYDHGVAVTSCLRGAGVATVCRTAGELRRGPALLPCQPSPQPHCAAHYGHDGLSVRLRDGGPASR